ncbi:MAG TPA: hypothetical protein VMT70_03260 [Vicinamibacteria bacterium]|nr:hypothetical protein [Vicinamibacteria bacterium]
MTFFARLDGYLVRRPVAIALLSLLFLYRLAFGLCSEFWFIDEKQIYLIGLKFFTTGRWPYFGPDLVLKGHERIYQIPGALQGLLVGLPFHVLPIPEAPFVLLNLLSFGALVLLAWYGWRRVPALPRWLVFGLALTLPWTLHYSTRVVNPSYVLAGSVLFFVGAAEALVFPDSPLLPEPLADALMGMGLLWVLQLHMSWTLLLPFAAAALVLRARRGDGLRALGAFATGAAATGSLLVPTLVVYGLPSAANTGIAVRFNPINARDLGSVIAKVLSFASYEMPRFMGPDNRQRLAWALSDLRVTPFAGLTLAVGLLQPIVMLLLWLRRAESAPGWRRMKWLMMATLLLTWGAFLFTVREPWALTFYLVFPVAFLYSLYCYAFFLKGERWLAFAAVVLVAGLVANTALAARNYRERSLYRDRGLVVRAIAERDHTVLGTRRPGTFY